MAHLIETMAAVGGNKTTWHKLGNEITEAKAVDNLVVTGTNWQAVVEQAFAYNQAQNSYHAIRDNFSVNRYDSNGLFMNSLAVVGGRFTVMQPRELAEFGDTLCEVSNGKAKLETGGCLDEGRKVWYLFKVGESAVIPGDSSEFQNYMLLWTGFDGSTKTEIFPTPIRVVCNNTLNFAIKGTQKKIAVRHTKTSHNRLSEAIRALGAASNYFESFNTLYSGLATTEFTKPQFEQLVRLLTPVKDENNIPKQTITQRIAMLEQFENTPGAMPGSAAGAVNAISYYEEHLKPTRGVEGSALLERRAENSLSLSLTQSALDLVLAATQENWGAMKLAELVDYTKGNKNLLADIVANSSR